jgi:hypothetical protein
VKAITWLEDDTGFISSSKDNVLIFWRLYPGSSDGLCCNTKEESSLIWKFETNKVVYNSICTYRPEGELPLIYVAGSDKNVREIKQKSNSMGI